MYAQHKKLFIMMNKALFLDRDGVINKDLNYVYKLEDLHFVPGIKQLIKRAYHSKYKIICISNQSGVGRNYFSLQDMNKFNQTINIYLENNNCPKIEAFYCAIGSPEDAKNNFREIGFFRKPFPGNFLIAKSDFNINLEKSIMVGDSWSDVVAANAAGVRNVYLYSKTSTIRQCNSCCIKINHLNQVKIGEQ